MRPIVLVVLALMLSSIGYAQPAIPQPDWKPWEFLIGEWVGTGTGRPGEGVGGFSFSLDLQKRILVRRNRADYPADHGRPASSHEDLMIVHPGESPDKMIAAYFDNEGHVIDYEVRAGATEWMFLSAPSATRPGFRLTYTKTGADAVGIDFEVSPPGKSSVLKSYIKASAKKVKK